MFPDQKGSYMNVNIKAVSNCLEMLQYWKANADTVGYC